MRVKAASGAIPYYQPTVHQCAPVVKDVVTAVSGWPSRSRIPLVSCTVYAVVGFSAALGVKTAVVPSVDVEIAAATGVFPFEDNTNVAPETVKLSINLLNCT